MSLSTDVFRTMTPEECLTFFQSLRDEVRPLYRQAEVVAASVLRVRPVYLGQQPFPKRIEMMRKALAMKVNAEASGEILAAFILEKHVGELSELLDLLGIEHEDGALKGTAPVEPEPKALKSAVEKFRKGENPPLREVILKAFAGQPAIEWPGLDTMVFGEAVAAVAPKPAPKPAPMTTSAPPKPAAKPAASAAPKPAAKPEKKATATGAPKASARPAAKAAKPAAGPAAKSAPKAAAKPAAKTVAPKPAASKAGAKAKKPTSSGKKS